MKGQINNFDFYDGFQAQKYWSFPSSYSKEKRVETLNTILYSGEYVGAEKKDGYWERVIKDDEGNLFMCSRNKGVNGVIEKINWVPHLHDFFNWLPNGTCLVGEIYLPNKTSKNIVSILGCLQEKAIKRQEKDEDKLKYYIFDILAWNGELLFDYPIKKRISYLKELKEFNSPYIEIAQYYDEPKVIHEKWLEILGNGGEGMVLVHQDYPYSFNKKTARKTLKLKKELEETIDVFLTGRYKEPTYLYTGKELNSWRYWYNNITGERVEATINEIPKFDGFDPVTKLWFNKWAGAVEIAVMKDGKTVPIGHISNVPDEVKEKITQKDNDFIGKVVELQAMEIDRSDTIPTLRHGKIVNWRVDKNPEDCLWDQLI